MEKEELKKLDFNKSEYDYILENCNFTDRQKQIFELRRSGKSIIEISFIIPASTRTVDREIRKIKNKILKLI